jgi:signal transduction histidine kinase
MEMLRPRASEVGASIDAQVQDASVRCRHELFGILTMNLLSNAIKFVSGRATRSIRLTTQVEEAWCVLTVADSGPGIPPEARERIFDPFFRVPGTQQPGWGIGLSTVKRIVTACQGRIEVESVVDQGTTFRV